MKPLIFYLFVLLNVYPNFVIHAQNYLNTKSIDDLINTTINLKFENPNAFYEAWDKIYLLSKRNDYDEGKLISIERKCSVMLGLSEYGKDDYIKLSNEGVELAKKLNDYEKQISILSLASYVKIDLGLLDEAEKDLELALLLVEKVNKKSVSSSRRFIYNALGNLHRVKKSSFETVEYYCLLAYRNAKLIESKAPLLNEIFTLAELYASDDVNYQLAKEFIKEGDSIAKILERGDGYIYQFNHVKGVYHYKLRDYEKSIYFFNKSLKYSEDEKLNIASYEILIKIFEAKNDLVETKKYINLLNWLKNNSLNSEKKSLQNIYENKLEKQRSSENKKNVIFYFVLSLVFVFTLYLYKYKFKKSQSTDFVDKNNALNPTDFEMDSKFESIYNQILTHFEENRPFLDENYSMSTLAIELNTNTAYLSKIINKKTNNNFKNFVNKYRIEEIKKKLKENQHKSYTIEHIYKSNGFSNQTTFNRAFKEIEGIAPKQYIESLKRKEL